MMYWSTLDFSVLQFLPAFTLTRVHQVSDAIQPSHPLLPPFPPAFSLSQHQGLFQGVGSLQQVAKILELQHQSFQWMFTVDFLSDWLVWSPCCPRTLKSLLFSTTVLRHLLALNLFYCPAPTSTHDYWKATIALTICTFVTKWSLWNINKSLCDKTRLLCLQFCDWEVSSCSGLSSPLKCTHIPPGLSKPLWGFCSCNLILRLLLVWNPKFQ